MPHLHIEAFKELPLPYEINDYVFDFIAYNAHHEDEKLISTCKDDKKFFLLLKDNDEVTLLKSDKIARPSDNYFVHNAINAYATAAQLEVKSSNLNLDAKNIHLQNDTAVKNIAYFANNFPQDKKVHIEVGFGSGRHLLHQAKNNPDKLFIGIEIYRPSIEQVLKQINIQELDNILLLDYDARLFLEFVPSNIVEKIYVHFPVPWDKKPHRRVISKDFIAESIRVLQEEGRLELRTDSENYYAYSYETFMSLNALSLEIHKNREIAVTSKYEDRWRLMEKNIYDITLTNAETSDTQEIKGDFSFSTCKELETLKELYSKTFKYTNGFVHFERLYIIDDTRIMFRLSLGSFERPVHLYLIVSKEEAHYYPALPIASQANLDAHKKIRELIDG